MTSTQEDLSWPELTVLGFLMGLVLIASWGISLACWLASPSFWTEDDLSAQQWDSRKDFRQSGLQPQRRDWGGIAIAVAMTAILVATLVALYPRPF